MYPNFHCLLRVLRLIGGKGGKDGEEGQVHCASILEAGAHQLLHPLLLLLASRGGPSRGEGSWATFPYFKGVARYKEIGGGRDNKNP